MQIVRLGRRRRSLVKSFFSPVSAVTFPSRGTRDSESFECVQIFLVRTPPSDRLV